jgi:adenylylsulfate kinase
MIPYTSNNLIVWIYGLPGSGQEDLGARMAREMKMEGHEALPISLDPISEIEKEEALKDFLDSLIPDSGVIFASSISPKEELRALAALAAKEKGFKFVECYLRLPLDLVIQRNPEGIIAKSIGGDVSRVPGLGYAFIQPSNPEIILEASEKSPEELVVLLARELNMRALIPPLSISVPQEEMANPFNEVPDDYLVALLHIDDAVASPDLIESWSKTFSAEDPCVLLFFCPGVAARRSIEILAPLIEEAGMSGEGTASLLLLAGKSSSEVEESLEDRVDFVLGEYPGLAIPSLTPSSQELRERLEAKRSA